MSGDRIEVSVVIAAYECRALLEECLASVSVAARRLPAEIIVIDNASSDGTDRLIAEHYPEVTFRRLEQNAGFSVANNVGTELARGEFILYLNPDTVIPPDALESAVDALRRRPSVGMLGCRLVKRDGQLDHACKRAFPTPAGALSHFLGLTRLRTRRFSQYTAGQLDEKDAGFVDAVNGAFMLVRRQAIEEVGPLDPGYWLYMEDLDWCYRFWQRGWAVFYWPGTTAIHVKGGSSGTRRSLRTNYWFHRGMWIFYRKHYAGRNWAKTATIGSAIAAKFAVSAGFNAMPRRRPAASVHLSGARGSDSAGSR